MLVKLDMEQYLTFSLTSKNNNIHFTFVMGKAAPLKQTAIPRLELATAVLAVKIDRMQKAELQFKWEDSVFWSDSTTVLKYIANTTRFQAFVVKFPPFGTCPKCHSGDTSAQASTLWMMHHAA